MEQETKTQISGFLHWLRETIIYILFWIVTAIAAFEAGVIFEFKGIDSNTKRVTKIEIAVGDLAGKVTAHDAILKHFKSSKKD